MINNVRVMQSKKLINLYPIATYSLHQINPFYIHTFQMKKTFEAFSHTVTDKNKTS